MEVIVEVVGDAGGDFLLQDLWCRDGCLIIILAYQSDGFSRLQQ